MPAFGSLALILALALSTYSLLAGSLSLRQLSTGHRGRILSEQTLNTARLTGIGSFLSVSAAVFALIWATFTNDFSVAYILHHSNRALPSAYKFAALWSGQEGSLLLWAWLLATYGLVLRIRHTSEALLMAYASTILAGIQLFFLLLLNFAAPPFALVPGKVPSDGLGLSPLLQYPEMVIHPPMLYLGYVGFSVPFAVALGALITRIPGKRWLPIARRWTMVTWMFLTCGIFLGAHWAYSVLGWGGYWGWDPVENASLMPWLTGTAFLHSVVMQEQRGMMKRMNVWLIFSTFMLSILGTLLTRSGLVSSVHAFAQSNIGTWFWYFLGIVFAVCLFAYLRQGDCLNSEPQSEPLLSRESSFVFNNLLLLMACFTVLWGTLFPVLSEYFQGNKFTMGPPFYNHVIIPIGLLLLFLMGIAPLLGWRGSSLRHIYRRSILPLVASLLTAGILLIAGVYPWKNLGTLYAFVSWFLATFVSAAIASEFVRGSHAIKRRSVEHLFASMIQLVRHNTRRHGGYLVHFGVAVIFAGIAGSAFNRSIEQELTPHQSITIGPYRLECVSYSRDSNLNYDSDYAVLDVYRNGRKVTQLAPERRFYVASQQPSTIVANHSTLLWDLYVVYAGQEPDTQHPIIKVFLNPLVAWIWIGVGIIVGGTTLALTPHNKQQ